MLSFCHNNLGKAFGENVGSAFAARLATGLVAGTATAVMRGGRIAVQQIATDAFGNALGQSLADASTGDARRATEAFALSDAVYGGSEAVPAPNTGMGLRVGGSVGLRYGDLRTGEEPITASNWGRTPTFPDVMLPTDYGLPVAGVRLPTTIGTLDQGSTVAGDVDAGAPRPGMTLTSEGWRDMNALAPVGGNGGLLADASRVQKVATPTKSISATYNDLAVQNYNDAKQLYNLSTGLQKTNPEFAKTYRSMADGYMAAGDNARNSAKGFYIYSEPMWKNATTPATAFAPGWNTGEYSAGTPYAGGVNKPDYVSVQLGLYVAAGGVSINLHNGDMYGQWSLNRAYPSYSSAPGLSIVTGKIIGGQGASDTNEFLGGGSAQGSAFLPSPIPLIGVGGGLNHSYGGKTAIETGLSFPPGVGVSPAGYGFELKSNKPK